MKTIYVWLITFVVMLILDLFWLGFVTKDFYAKELGSLARQNVNLVAGLLAWTLMSIGLVFFVLNNSYSNSVYLAILVGGALGFLVYGVYDLTNLAVLKDYSIKMTIIDILWGTFLFGVLGGFSKYLSTL